MIVCKHSKDSAPLSAFMHFAKCSASTNAMVITTNELNFWNTLRPVPSEWNSSMQTCYLNTVLCDWAPAWFDVAWKFGLHQGSGKAIASKSWCTVSLARSVTCIAGYTGLDSCQHRLRCRYHVSAATSEAVYIVTGKKRDACLRYITIRQMMTKTFANEPQMKWKGEKSNYWCF